MKVSFIKYEKENIFFLPKLVGVNVEEIKEPEKVDEKMKELRNENYTTIVISSELASFSENIISKYKYDENFNIIILPTQSKK